MARDVTLMLGFRSNKQDSESADSGSRDIAKLFFDAFSKRVDVVEENLRNMSADLEKLKMSGESGQISDLVLLERLQKTEALIKESLGSILDAIGKTRTAIEFSAGEVQSRAVARIVRIEPAIASQVLSPTGEVGSLPSITTPTELQVLTLLAGEGPKSAPEIGKAVGRSREHTARLMKKLFEDGYIRRDQSRIPFRYSVVDRLKQAVKKPESKDEGKEPISVPQT